MLVVMKAQATPEEIQAVCECIEQLGLRAHPLPGAQRTAIGITGNKGELDRGNLESLSGVAEVIRVSKANKRVISGSALIMRSEAWEQVMPSLPAPRKMRRMLYCVGVSWNCLKNSVCRCKRNSCVRTRLSIASSSGRAKGLV